MVTRHETRRLAVQLALLGVLALVAAGCKGTNVISTKEEVELGKQVSAEIERKHRVDRSSPGARRVADIGRRLLTHANERPDVPYSFAVLESKEVNAVSLPGGPIYVYRGLLDLLKDDDDALACVIAHEVGHVNGRHVAKLISQRYLASAGIGLILRDRAAVNLAALAEDMLSLHYGREDEYEADRRGLSYSHRAGFDPRGMVRFFRKMQTLEQGKGAPEFLRSHPVTSSRLARAERIIETRDYPYGK